MSYQIELPEQLESQAEPEIYVTLCLPADSVMPTVRGQWERADNGDIIARYTRPQLIEAIWAGLSIRIGDTEERLERGEQLLIAAQSDGDQAKAERLACHYAALLRDMARLVDACAECRASFYDT